MRHALGVLGVLAAAVLLLVSAAMNWRFGYSLGKSELDSQLLGLASAAADGLKALIPFFLFAALRTKQWPQAMAAALLWVVCLGYSLTSALGFSALNRADTQGARQVQAVAFADLQTELEKVRERMNWVPQHRPAATVSAEMEALKQNKRWASTNGCSEATASASRAFCEQYHQLGAELAAATEADKLQARIDQIRSQLATTTTAVALAGADPQAEVLSKLSGQHQEIVQTALTVMVAILVELGSSLGFFVAFSTWKVYERREDAMPVPVVTTTAEPVVAAEPAAVAAAVPSANDNRTVARLVAPETDVEKFYKDRITTAEGSSLTATALYEDYCDWCEEAGKEPMALPTFGRQFGELGVHKAKIAGRIRYIGIRLHSGTEDEDIKTPNQIGVAA